MSEESNNNSKSESSRKLVLPGDLLETKSKPGKGIFRNKGLIYSSVIGFSNDRSGYMNVNSIKGRYNPKVGDKVVAICNETGPSVWRMNIGASFNSTLHHSESGWKVPFGDTARFLDVGDAIWGEIFMVDAAGDSEGMLLSVFMLNGKTIYDLFLCHQRIVLLLFFHYWYFNFYLSESVSLLYTEPYQLVNKDYA